MSRPIWDDPLVESLCSALIDSSFTINDTEILNHFVVRAGHVTNYSHPKI